MLTLNAIFIETKKVRLFDFLKRKKSTDTVDETPQKNPCQRHPRLKPLTQTRRSVRTPQAGSREKTHATLATGIANVFLGKKNPTKN